MTPKTRVPIFDTAMFTTLRLFFHSAIRMIYPFIPFFSSGIKVDITAISIAISLSMAASLIGPFLAPVADRYGRRTGMLLGLAIFTFGNSLAALFPTYLAFVASLLLANLGGNIFIPAMQAYLSDRTHYKRRGLVLGFTELSWAMSFILVVPLFGLLMKATSWNVPFAVLSFAGALGIGLVFWKVKYDGRHSTEGEHIYAGFRKLFKQRSAIFMLLVGFSMVVANEMVNVVFSVWMKDSFQVNIATLGLASLVIGISELGGEGLTITLADRLGKERSVLIGLVSNCLVLAALPLLGKTETGAFIWLFLFYLTFEYAVTASWPLSSEVMPLARATMLSAFFASHSLGRALGALVGPWIYRMGFMADAVICIIFNIICIILLSRIRLHDTENKEAIPTPD